MSEVPPIAAIRCIAAIGRDVPKPAVSDRSKAPSLFDHLVGAAEQRKRESNAQRLGSIEVDDQLDFHRLLNRQVSRFGAVENPAGIDGGLAICIGKTGAVAHQAAGRSELT